MIQTSAVTSVIDELDRRLIQSIENGLPLMHRPYLALARDLGCDEATLLGRLQRLIDIGLIRRYGVVVRHRELGYRANGMVVWDVDDDDVASLGRRLAAFPCVTLSYRRPRRLPAWPYNLFTMVHGRNREQVLTHVGEIVSACALEEVPHEILFSTRRFKQRGASYRQPAAVSLMAMGD